MRDFKDQIEDLRQVMLQSSGNALVSFEQMERDVVTEFDQIEARVNQLGATIEARRGRLFEALTRVAIQLGARPALAPVPMQPTPLVSGSPPQGRPVQSQAPMRRTG